jgi:hypothetical protein
MSTTHAPTPQTRSATRRDGLLGRLLGGGLLAATLAGAAFALWPASEADKARSDGEQLGQSVRSLYYADTEAEVEDALVDLDQAADASREHGGDAVADQVAAQEEALERAADGFVGTLTAETSFDQDLYQAELDYAVDDLARQSSDFREEGPAVHQAYWEGYEEGLSGD